MSESLSAIDRTSAENVLNGFGLPNEETGSPELEGVVYLVDIHTFDPSDLVGLVLDKTVRSRLLGERKEGTRVTFLFFSHLRKLNSWPTSILGDTDRLKENRFYVQVFLAYRLGKVVSWKNAVDSSKLPIELVTRLKRVAVQQSSLCDDIWGVLDQIKAKALNLREIAIKELGNCGPPDLGLCSSTDTPVVFLKTLAVLYQLGRGPHDQAERLVASTIPWLSGHGGSYKLSTEIDNNVRRALQDGFVPPSLAMTTTETHIKLKVYQIFRDLSRWLAAGPPHWAEGREEIRALIIDETLTSAQQVEDKKSLNNRLGLIQSSFGEHRLTLDYVANPNWDVLKASLDQERPVEVIRFSNDAQNRAEQLPSSYDIILVEIEFGSEYIGPKVVQALATYFDTNQRGASRPTIIVLTRAEHFGHIQQCLNFGAEAYVLKERIYTLPAHIAKMRSPSLPTEPRGRKSNFRSLYQLTPRDVKKLQSTDDDDLIHGYEWDELDRRWLKSLPKADLHYHIGTSISLPTIEALAVNSAGYLIGSDERLLRNLEEDIVGRICALALMTGIVRDADLDNDCSPDKYLSAAFSILQTLDVPPRMETNGQGIYETLVHLLALPHRQMAPFEVLSLLVTTISRLSDYSNEDPPISKRVADQWSYIRHLHDWMAQPQGSEFRTVLSSKVIELCRRITSDSWHRGLTSQQVKSNFESENFQSSWELCHEQIKARNDLALKRLDEYLKQSVDTLKSNLSHIHSRSETLLGYDTATRIINKLNELTWPPRDSSLKFPTLKELVTIPTTPESEEQNLLRYLWGAGLLGAEHLQYPENILLATKDLIEQAVSDNIVYSEIRCATTGYCAGGMSALDATDLLCLSFDLAAAFFALYRSSRWVRINVLLGAKRHKTEEEFQSIVSLLSYYLQRGEFTARFMTTPDWWKPTRVVGFDLSGDESRQASRFRKRLEPLFTYCAPITIHAGEAATAESIWQAVYRLGARRIGHGLRLRENKRLLNYCITEGICMEMCPISNKFTNGFDDIASRFDYRGQERQYYPLRYYMDLGLDVCINTDNRQLHVGQTLTDDYMCAARMVGGLTKWEILKTIKAGFKHAFLAKADIETLLGAVENEVYQLVSGSV